MKTLKIVVITCLVTVAASAQKIIEKSFVYDNQFITLDVKFARNIEIKTWDEKKVYFKATVITEEERFIDKYEVNFEESSSYITIEEQAKPLFKAMQEYAKKNDWKNREYWYNAGDRYKFYYVLYVPQGAKFKVESINGDLESERIDGDFEADLINGDIQIKAYSGLLTLKTINGEIDLKVGNVDFIAETVNGDIYADEKLKLTSDNKRVGQKVQGLASNSGTRLKLKTVNGNMYLRL
ncbi:MAG: hypothetical protein ACFB0A_05865 [Croceivirga sp.]